MSRCFLIKLSINIHSVLKVVLMRLYNKTLRTLSYRTVLHNQQSSLRSHEVISVMCLAGRLLASAQSRHADSQRSRGILRTQWIITSPVTISHSILGQNPVDFYAALNRGHLLLRGKSGTGKNRNWSACITNRLHSASCLRAFWINIRYMVGDIVFWAKRVKKCLL